MPQLPIDSQVATIAHVIQLSIAPVFLITAVSTLIGTLTNRLARIIDRARLLEEYLTQPEATQPKRLHEDLATLSRRARLINLGITLSVATALFVSAVIVTLFAGSFLHADLTAEVAGLFIVALVLLIGALFAFLREIAVATAALRIGPH